jgi:hypothetical protein
MRPPDRELARRLEAGLLSFDKEKHPILGIRDPASLEVFIEQLLDSIHRVKYVSVIRNRKLSERNTNPKDEMFDPIKAAILHHRRGNIDEAFWLVFLFAQFGKHAKGGWWYAREIYGRLGDGNRWDWATTSINPSGFRDWLNNHQNELKREGVPHGFGNHRKYESLDAYSPNGTGATVESYVRWVSPPKNHQDLIEEACQQAGGNPQMAFNHLYVSMGAVARFGRMARFDYLTMVSNLGLAPIEPGSTYMQNSTGPIQGARLLFGGQKTEALNAIDLNRWLIDLDANLLVGMQVIEDALCNWQKSPEKFVKFRG